MARWGSRARVGRARNPVTIGIVWINHHRLFTHIHQASHGLLLWNGLLLMCVAVIPFTSGLVAASIGSAHGPQLRTGRVLRASGIRAPGRDTRIVPDPRRRVPPRAADLAWCMRGKGQPALVIPHARIHRTLRGRVEAHKQKLELALAKLGPYDRARIDIEQTLDRSPRTRQSLTAASRERRHAALM